MDIHSPPSITRGEEAGTGAVSRPGDLWWPSCLRVVTAFFCSVGSFLQLKMLLWVQVHLI